MKKMTVREESRGKMTKVSARKTYLTGSGEWVAEVDGNEFQEACTFVCEDVQDCACEKLHVEADLDDDGKQYRVLSR